MGEIIRINGCMKVLSDWSTERQNSSWLIFSSGLTLAGSMNSAVEYTGYERDFRIRG